MSDHQPKEVTELLRAWARGDRAALDRLVPLVSDELHGLAHRYMQREPAGHSLLQTTALVNEAYLRLVDVNRIAWHDRAHFFAVCATVMRRVLVDAARARRNQKRGGRFTVIPLNEQVPAPEPPVDVLALDEALAALARFDPQGARVVELRFFGGLSEEETAEVIGLSSRTIRREWTAAKTWLLGALRRHTH